MSASPARRRWSSRLSVVVSLSLLAGLAATVVEPITGPAPAAAVTTTFAYTGTPQMYVVPAGVTSINVTVSGAGGGTPSSGGTGGAGGTVTATVAVTPGQVLQVNVGGAGSLTGGWNGGGSNYGGGASDIRTDPVTSVLSSCAFTLSCTLSDRLVVAGGGGGGGANNGASGGTGGNVPTDGVADNGAGADATAGEAATVSAGGAAGTGTVTGTTTSAATAGAAGVGGAGGTWSDAGATPFTRGGGGGGGYFGGGGGGVSGSATYAGSGGGGGGKSYAGGAGVSGASFSDGVTSGNGVVEISEANALPSPSVFSYTGAAQVYSVPSDTSLVAVRLYGGAGGGSGGGTPGQGDVVWGTFPVSPGGFLQINVGGKGTGLVDDGTGAMNSAASYRGGWNGGGHGAQANLANGAVAGGGGGGATDIRMCGIAAVGGCNVTERRVIAAGGGGASLNSGGTNGGGNADGSAPNPTGASSGQGGTLTAGGAGGSLSSVNGEDGGTGYGGSGRPASGNVEGAGGGGAGLYGGGGGNSGAGGGGSSCASVTGACTLARNLVNVPTSGWGHSQGGNLGAGYAVITPVSVARTGENASTPAQPTAPSSVVADAATIHGAVNPMGLAAQARVYYATTSAAIDIPGTGSSVLLNETGGSNTTLTGTSWLNVEGGLTGLTASTTYYYRVCAESVAGRDCGPIKSFATMVGPAQPTVGNPTVQLLTITNTAANFTGAVTNPGTGPTNVVFECATDAAFTTGLVTGTATPSPVTGVTSINVNGSCTGLTAGTDYYVRIKATNTGSPAPTNPVGVSATPATFTTVSAPTISAAPTVTAGSIASSFAAFAGTVNNPGGGTSMQTTAISFECSTDPTFPGTVSAPTIVGPAAPSVATGLSSVNVTGSCSNLDDYTDYYVRLVATNSAGTTVSSVTGPFLTLAVIVPPVISSAPTTSNITTTSVTLAGTVNNPGHGPTSIFFDCSTTSSFTSVSTVSFPANPPSATGLGSVNVTGSCAGLSTATAYYTRLRAVNTAAPSGVTSTSATFTTLAAPSPPTVGTLAMQSGAGALTETTADLEVSITNPGIGPTTVVIQCSTSPTFPTGSTTQSVTTTGSPVSGTSPVTGLTAQCSSLTPFTQYYARAKASNSAAPSGMFSSVVSFTTLAYAITPTLGSLTVVNGSVTTTSVSFTANVTNPGSGGSSSAWSTTTLALECATNSSFTAGLVTGTLTNASAQGRSPVSTTGTCTGLTPNTPYYARVSATSTITDPTDPNHTASQPYTVYSTSATFTTPPVKVAPTVTNLVVATNPATTDNSASFTVDVNPGYDSTSVLFECSTSSSFATVTASVIGSPSPISGGTAQSVAATCAPLADQTQYYVRVKATNSIQTTTSTSVTVTTLASITLPATSNASLTPVVSPAVNPGFTSVLLSGQVTSTGNGTADAEFECASSASFAGAVAVTAYTDAGMTTPATGLTGLSAIALYGECGTGTVSDPALTPGTTYYARIRVWNSAGSAYSSTPFSFTTPLYVVTASAGAITASTTTVDSSGSAPWTATKATLTGSVTNPGSGNVTGSWSDTTVGFQCALATDTTFSNPITGTVTTPLSGVVAGRTAVTVAGTCAGLTPNTSYIARVSATNTITDPNDPNYAATQPHTVYGATSSAFTTVNIVVPPTYVAATIPTPPSGTPTIPTVTSITTPGTTANTTEVVGVVDANTTVTIKVNGVERMSNATPPVPTDVCTVTGTAYVCILDPDVAAGQTLTVISTDPTATPNPLSSHIDVLVPSSGTIPGTMGTQIVTADTSVAEKVTFSAKVNPGVGPTTVTYVYSANPLFATASFASVPVGQLVECTTGNPVTGTSTATLTRQCVGFTNTVTTYWVRVKSDNTPTNGQTGSPYVPAWSNATMFTTIERSWAPSAPLGVSVTASTFTSLSLSAIVDPGNASTTVTYECATDSAFTNIVDTVVSSQSPVTGSNVRPTTATCTGLTAATQYYIRVVLVNSVGNGTATTTGSTASTPAPPAPSGGGGGGNGGPPPKAPGSLGPVTPSPFLVPGEFSTMEDGVPVASTYTATANGAQISRSDFSVTFRGLSRDREPMALGPAPDSEVIIACQGFVQIAGNGFQNSSVGQLFLFAGGTPLYSIPMNSSGGFTVTVPLPTELEGGEYDLQLNAYGKAGDPPAVRSVTIGVRVDVCPPPPPVTIIGKKLTTTVQQVYFDEWSAELDKKAKDTLLKLVKQTTTEPLKVKSVGFVQGIGTPQKGWELSQQRADNVLAFLTGKGGMTPKEAVAKGRNVDGNVNPNRMVQVTVTWAKPVKKQVEASKVPPGATIVDNAEVKGTRHPASVAPVKPTKAKTAQHAKASKATKPAKASKTTASKKATKQASKSTAKPARKQAGKASKAAAKKPVTKPVTKASKKAPSTKAKAETSAKATPAKAATSASGKKASAAKPAKSATKSTS